MFTIAVLGRLTGKAKSDDVGKGFVVGRNNMELMHLRFADDTIFFLDARETWLKNLELLLELFCKVSRLKFNLSKSTLLAINVYEIFLNELTSQVGCEMGLWP